MAFKLASLFVELGAQDGPLKKTLAGIKGQVHDLAKARFDIPGGGLVGALGLAGAGVGLVKVISGASDLSETMSKVGVTFGESQKEVTAAAEQMARSFGIPKREFLDAASALGLIATGMGQSKAEAAAMSSKFAKLAVDASSFYNVPVADALEKIRAGLTGESEPLKAFGVIMDEDTMKAYALANGLAKKGQEMSNAAKLAARAGLIEKGLAAASGDMERTQDGVANSTRKFWGMLENLGDTIGTLVLPAVQSLLGLANEMATDLAAAAASSTGSWSGFFGFFTGAIDALGVVYRNWGDIVERTGIKIYGSLQNAWEYLEHGGRVAGTVAEFIFRQFATHFANLVQVAFNLKDSLVAIFQEVWDYVKSGFTDPIDIKLKPVLEGIKAHDLSFAMPELQLSSVADQLAEVDARMAGREQARADAKAKAAEAARAKGAAGPGEGGKAAGGGGKVGVTDADAYARELQEGALKAGGDVNKDILAQAQKQTELLERIARKDERARAFGATFG